MNTTEMRRLPSLQYSRNIAPLLLFSIKSNQNVSFSKQEKFFSLLGGGVDQNKNF